MLHHLYVATKYILLKQLRNLAIYSQFRADNTETIAINPNMTVCIVYVIIEIY